MATTIPDFTLDPRSPTKTAAKGEFPDYLAPSPDERLCAEYETVRNAIEQGVRAELRQGMTGDEILNRWCEDRGLKRKDVVLKALRFNMASEAEYAALVAGEPAVEAGTPDEETESALAAAEREELERAVATAPLPAARTRKR